MNNMLAHKTSNPISGHQVRNPVTGDVEKVSTVVNRHDHLRKHNVSLKSILK